MSSWDDFQNLSETKQIEACLNAMREIVAEKGYDYKLPEAEQCVYANPELTRWICFIGAVLGKLGYPISNVGEWRKASITHTDFPIKSPRVRSVLDAAQMVQDGVGGGARGTWRNAYLAALKVTPALVAA